MIDVICMTFNGSALIQRVLNSFEVVGNIRVFIDSKTTDSTYELTKKYNPEFFTFEDFSQARNYCFSRCTAKYRIVIDDSFIFKGDPVRFRNEIVLRNIDCMGVRIQKGSFTYYSKRITKQGLLYTGIIHEDIDATCSYTMTMGRFEELVIKSHIYRTINRKDLLILMPMYEEQLRNGCVDPRTVFLISSTYLLLHIFNFCSKRVVLYWLIQRITMNHEGEEKDLCITSFRSLK